MSAVEASRGGGRRSTVVWSLVTAIVVVAAFATAWYRVTYNVWPGQGADERVHWCGRDYQTGGGTETLRQITAGTTGTVHAVGSYPPLGLSRQTLVVATSASTGCFAVAAYLRTGADRYRPYSLLGGP